MSLCEWALEAYARPGVPEACLELQDAHGQNVCLLLWVVWARPREAELLARAAATARDWERVAVAPLRTIRRALKAPAPPVDDVAREALRDEIKTAELCAERVLLETLEGMTSERGGVPALQALRATCAAWGRPAPDERLAALASALG